MGESKNWNENLQFPQDKIRNTDRLTSAGFLVERALRLRLEVRITKGDRKKATFSPQGAGVFAISKT